MTIRESKFDRVVRLVSEKYNLDADEVRVFCSSRTNTMDSCFRSNRDCVEIASRIYWMIKQYNRETTKLSIYRTEITPDENYRQPSTSKAKRFFIEDIPIL